jgi:hypothetical protein
MAEGMVSGGAQKKRKPKYLCGTPDTYCIGSLSSVSNGLRKSRKAHGQPEEAFACYAQYLIKQGYTQCGPREFYLVDKRSGEAGPIVVLTKKSRFGARLRGGKGNRYTPEGEATGGTIISM